MVANNIWIQLRGAQSHSTHCALVWYVVSPISLWSKTQLLKPVVCTVLNRVQCWVMTGLEERCLSLFIPTGNMSTFRVKKKNRKVKLITRGISNANWLLRQPLKASFTDHLLPDMHFSRLSNPTKGGMTNRHTRHCWFWCYLSAIYGHGVDINMLRKKQCDCCYRHL